MNFTLKNLDFKEECKAYMSEKGLSFDGLILVDGKIHRYSADSKKNKPDEWYVAHEGYTSSGNYYFLCIFGSWSEDSKYEYKSFDKENRYSDIEINELKLNLQKQNDLIEHTIRISQNKSALEAQQLWKTYHEVPLSNEYLKYTKLKNIEPVGEVKFGNNPQNYPSIIIPIRNIFDELRSLQFISLDQNGKSYKSFLTGGEKKGNFFLIGSVTSSQETIFVTEGYATGVTVYKATNKPVIIAFDAGNLMSVIENLKTKFSQARIIIAGDNDEIGVKKAKEVAKIHSCETVFPSFSEKYKREVYMDFNDLYQICGLDAVKKQLSHFIINNNLKALAENYLLGKEEPCDSFKLSALPIPLREYIATICKTTNAHPIMVTSSVLTMVSAFLGTKVFISEREYFQNLYPNLWILCIAKSGQFKTTALNKGAKISFDNQSQIFKAIKEIQKSSSQDQVEQQILNKSLENVVLPTKQTAEGFLEYLSQGHQGAIYASEFGGWLQNLDKTHNNDFKAILTEFYDVPSYYRYKTKTQGDCIIETPYISICGVSTMPWVRTNLKPSDVPSGFFARFLVFVPPFQEGIPPAFPTPIENLSLIEEEKFKSFLEKILNDIGQSRAFHLTKEARKVVETFHKYIYSVPQSYSDKAKDILEPYLKRWSPYLIKLAMIIQLFIDPKTDQIGAAAITSAMSILIPAMKSTASLFEGELGESVHQRKCRVTFEFICKKIKETGKPVKRQTILTSKKLDGGVKEYDEILLSLIEQGKINCKERKPKNDSEYYLIGEIEKN